MVNIDHKHENLEWINLSDLPSGRPAISLRTELDGLNSLKISGFNLLDVIAVWQLPDQYEFHLIPTVAPS